MRFWDRLAVLKTGRKLVRKQPVVTVAAGAVPDFSFRFRPAKDPRLRGRLVAMVGPRASPVLRVTTAAQQGSFQPAAETLHTDCRNIPFVWGSPSIVFRNATAVLHHFSPFVHFSRLRLAKDLIPSAFWAKAEHSKPLAPSSGARTGSPPRLLRSQRGRPTHSRLS